LHSGMGMTFLYSGEPGSSFLASVFLNPEYFKTLF
jgi:hypothetical protein